MYRLHCFSSYTLTFLCLLDDMRTTVNDTNIVGTTYRKNIQAGREYQLIALFNSVNTNAITALLATDSSHEHIIIAAHIDIWFTYIMFGIPETQLKHNTLTLIYIYT